METDADLRNPAISAAYHSQPFPPLDKVTRPTVPTDQAAYYLNRKSQTLRMWACLEKGALRPIRINGRLAWHVDDIRELLDTHTSKGGK